MKTLLIVRHSEAAPAGAQGSDHQRPLSASGADQAKRLAIHVSQRDWRFTRVLCSSAARARATAEAVIAGLAPRVTLHLTDALYNAPGEAMLVLLETQTEPDESVLLVAHMPGVAELADLLVESSIQGDGGFQPGTLAVINLDIERWRDIHPGCGTMQSIIRA